MKGARFYVKAAGLALLVAVLGAGAALVAVRMLFPEPRARAWVVDAARRQLGRDVRLEAIDVGLGGLSLSGLEVSERPDFSAGTFLRVEKFRLRPSWRALLRRRLVVAAVAADGLKVRVIKGADGRFNYETLASSAPAPAPSKPGAAAPPELNVRSAVVSNGSVEYADASGSSWTLTDVELDLSDFSETEPFTLKTSFQIRGTAGTRPVDARASFDGRVALGRGGPDKFKATVKRLVLAQQGLELSASGTISRLDAPELSFDAVLSAAGRELLRAGGSAKIGDAASADLKWRTPGLDTTLLAKLAPQAGVPALDLPAAEGSFAGAYSGDGADVKFFSASWADGKLEGSGSVRGLKSAKPLYEGRASFGFPSPEIRPGQYPFLNLPPKLALPAARVDGELSLKDDVLKIVSLTAKPKAGTLTANGAVRALGTAKPIPDVVVAAALDLPAFKASDLPFAVPGVPGAFTVPAGRLEGSMRASGENIVLKGVSFKTKGAEIHADGIVAPVPDAAFTADLTLPALTDKDLPFPGVPPGLQMPPSHWTADAAYSPRVIRVKSLRATTGGNDVEASGTVADPAGRGAYDLLIKCRSFQLEELTQLTPKTRDLKLSGSGLFAFSMTGVKDKPVYAGKLQFNGLGATVAQLPLSDFAGTVSFDAKRVDVPNLKGKFGDGLLTMDLTVKDYASAPEIELEASLDRFDLGRYLAAKAKVAADRAAAKTAGEKKAGDEKKTAVSTRGHLNIGTLVHPTATVTDVKVSWNLRGLAADLRGLNGDAKFHVGGGRIRSAGDMAAQSKLVKILIFPLLVVQKIGRIGGLHLFPDFNDISLNQIVGDYGFENGLMTLRQSEMDSDAAQVAAKGTIDLPAEALDLVVTAQVARVAPIDVSVTGTFDNPKSKVHLAKFLLADPAKNLIQGLFK
ncbi:MAG: AsmA-like C-terminal region-containing protein [Elusimicrobiota bacterium]